MNIVVGVISNDEVLVALQQDAVELHKRNVYLSNNDFDKVSEFDHVYAMISYDSILISIERQINSLFL